MTDGYDEPYYDEDRQCCRETAIVVYRGGVVSTHCYKGDPSYPERLERAGHLRALNASVLIIGAE